MERGGPTSQSGILYQNSVAALYLGRLCDGTPRPDKHAVVSVRVEAPSAVDDIVVTYKDDHRSFVQTKENVRDDDEAWRRLWKAFENQFWSADFHLGKDRLVLQVGEIHDEHHDLREICDRTGGSMTHAEWLSRLTKSQRSLSKRIKALLEPEHSAADEEVLSLFRHIDVHIRPLGDIERDMVRDWIPPTNKTQLELFKLLRDAAADASRRRLSLSTTDLQSELAAECGVSFVSQPSFNDLLESVKACGASLKQHRHTFGNTGAHLKRQVVETIISWVLGSAKQTDVVGILVDRAGVGKTVVMQDVLTGLEAAGVNVLAIKADLLASANTTEDLRQHLQLPDTVERVVQRLAEQSTSVLLIDQIDALSLSLARDQRTLDLVLDLVARARMISGTRVLLSCRTFDLNNSSQLRNLKSRKFEVTELTEDEVREVILNLGDQVDFDHLSLATRQLLRIPLHLDLFLRVLEERSTGDINARGNAIENLQDLYTALWQTVIRRAEPSAPSITDRELVLKLITDEMNRTMKTTAPQSLLSSQSPDLDRAAQWLASQGILVPNQVPPGLEWAYLHQTFFDYCYAKNFLDERKSLFEIVRNGEQGLFARPQIIHVLEFLRGVDRSQYLKEVWAFLNASASDLRFHLRDHVLRWFGSVLSPTDDEWLMAQRLLVDVDCRSAFLRAAEGNSGWFYRLKAHMQKSLDSGADEAIERETLPYLYSMVNANQAEIINLLAPYKTKSDTWKARVYNITRFIRDWKSEKAISLFEERFREAPVDKLGESYEIHEIAKAHPRAACRLIRIALDRILDEHLSTREIDGVTQFYLLHLPPALEILNGSTITDALGKIATQEPRYFLDTLLPWLVRVVTVKPELNDESYTFASDALSHSWYGSPYVVHHEINRSFINALTELGNTSRPDFDHVAGQIKSLNYNTPQRYLVNAYNNLVSSMTDDAVKFLISDPRRLDLGDHQQYDTRQLIKAMVPYLNDDQFVLLESAILSYEPLKKWRGIGALRWRGVEKLYLLQCLPQKRLSSFARRQLSELERKFPGIQASEDPGTAKGGWVGPPIPDDIAQKMSDKTWLRAMTKYKGSVQHKDSLKGGAQQQGAVLSRLAKENPERFFRLAMRAPLDTDEAYVCALISGLSQSTTAAERTFDVIRRFKDSATRYVKQAIAAAIEKRVDDGIPDDLVALLESYVKDQPGEDETWWQREEEMSRRDGRSGDIHGGPYSGYLNSVRGAAMRVLMRIFEHRGDVASKWKLVESAVADESVAIKAGAIEELLYLLDDDRSRALMLFDKVMEGQPSLLRSHFTDDFVYYGFFKNYLRMKPHILDMMNDSHESIQQRGAELACIAAISPKGMESELAAAEAQTLAQAGRVGPIPWRRGAAHVYGLNAGRGVENCAEYLTQLVNDEDEQVRRFVGGSFHSLSAEDISSLRPFIEAFAASRSLQTGFHEFTDFLLEHGSVYPVWALTVVEMILNNQYAAQSEMNYGGGEELVRLVLRVYIDPTVEALTRERAMDNFDRLMQASAWAAQRVLREWDRS